MITTETFRFRGIMSLIPSLKIIHVLYISCNVLPVTSSVTVETCNAEEAVGQCENNQVLVASSAEYGRSEKGRCVKHDEYIGCWTDVLPVVDKLCSGRSQCKFLVPDPELEEMNRNSQNTCPEYLRMYLKFEYNCVNVESQCTGASSTIHADHALLSSYVAQQTGCGSSSKPWKISVSQGKTINMTLFDFVGDTQPQGHNYVTCKYVYGYIVERSLGINHTICGGQGRERALYSSKTNNVEVYLNKNLPIRYLVKTEAVGCADLTRPLNSWYKREGNEAVIGCEANNLEWHLTCTGNTWHGTVGSCNVSESNKAQLQNDAIPENPLEVQFTSVILLTAIAACVLLVVVIAVMCGVIYLKKYRMKQETKRIQTTYATMTRHQQQQNYPPGSDNFGTTQATEAPSDRLLDLPGSWSQSDTFRRQGTTT